MERKFDIFTYSCGISKDMLDELGHANYNELKKVFERVRFDLCHYLGFRRSTLMRYLGLGLFMKQDNYEYLLSLKQGDNISFMVNIEVEGPAEIKITLKVLRLRPEDGLVGAVSNIAIYKMIMVNLKTEKPTRIPKGVLRSIGRWQENQKLLMGTFERNP